MTQSFEASSRQHFFNGVYERPLNTPVPQAPLTGRVRQSFSVASVQHSLESTGIDRGYSFHRPAPQSSISSFKKTQSSLSGPAQHFAIGKKPSGHGLQSDPMHAYACVTKKIPETATTTCNKRFFIYPLPVFAPAPFRRAFIRTHAHGFSVGYGRDFG